MSQNDNILLSSRRPRVTVAAIVHRDERFLLVEEHAVDGGIVFNQPAGHVEAGESILEALTRETFEETGWRIRPESLVGVYLWQHPNQSISYLRIAMSGIPENHDANATLDEGIVQAHWLTRDELARLRPQHRSPLVMRCIEDYLAGERYPLSVLKSLLG